METTIILAKVLGIYFIVSGVFVVTHKKTLGILLKDIFNSRAITYLIGIALVLGGGALIYRGNTGEGALAITVAILSWAVLIKGIFYVFLPDYLYKMTKSIPRSTMTLVASLTILVGIYFVFFL